MPEPMAFFPSWIDDAERTTGESGEFLSRKFYLSTTKLSSVEADESWILGQRGLLGNGEFGRVKFPQGGDMRRAPVVLEILKRHACDLTSERLRQIAAVLQVELEPVRLELGLNLLARRTILAVHRRFHDHARRIAVGRCRNFQVYIAVTWIN